MKNFDGSSSSNYHTVTHPEEFHINWKAFYEKADELTTAARESLPHELDIPFGDHPKQRLDLYAPEEKSSGWPVFVFFHGGGFREGDRADYGFVASPFVHHNILTVVAGYRLTPSFRYPDAHDDARQALAWVFQNIASRGGDTERIYVGGHSSGANLSAFVSVKTDWLEQMSLPADMIKGCAPVSTSYDLRIPTWVREYLPDPELRGEASPILNIQTVPRKTVVGVGSLEEKAGRVKSSKEFVRTLKERGGEAELVLLEGCEHDVTALATADEGSELFQAIRRMFDS